MVLRVCPSEMRTKPWYAAALRAQRQHTHAVGERLRQAADADSAAVDEDDARDEDLAATPIAHWYDWVDESVGDLQVGDLFATDGANDVRIRDAVQHVRRQVDLRTHVADRWPATLAHVCWTVFVHNTCDRTLRQAWLQVASAHSRDTLAWAAAQWRAQLLWSGDDDDDGGAAVDEVRFAVLE
jgi:hypothetical protein